MMAATLAAGGKNPITGKRVLDESKVPGVLAVMATAGLYDDSGKWLYHTGLPGKSGVGGGIIAVSPGKFGIAVVSPPLDDAGNSVKAQKAITTISNALGGNPYLVKNASKGLPAETERAASVLETAVQTSARRSERLLQLHVRDFLDIRQDPFLLEERHLGSVEAKQHFKPTAGICRYPV